MRLTALALVLLASLAHAVELNGNGRVWLGPGLDTNPNRGFIAGDPDALLFGLGELNGSADWERVSLVGSYDLAFRKFITRPEADTLIQNARLDGTLRLGKAFSVGLSGHARDRRGADRDYSDLVGEGVIDFRPDQSVDVRLRLGAHRFIYWPNFQYSFSGPDGTLLGRYRFDRRHSVSFFGSVNLRTYNALTHELDEPDPPPQVTRRDSVFQVGASYTYRGPFHLTLGYSYYDQTSNSHGESLRRHRLSATYATKLPFDLTLLATTALQLTLYPDDIYLSTDILLLDDDENSSSVTLKLVKPLSKHFEVDLRYALYVNLLPQSNLLYLRQVVSAGVSFLF